MMNNVRIPLCVVLFALLLITKETFGKSVSDKEQTVLATTPESESEKDIAYVDSDNEMDLKVTESVVFNGKYRFYSLSKHLSEVAKTKRIGIQLIEQLHDHDINTQTAEVVSLQVQRSNGFNYRVCMKDETHEFMVEFWLPSSGKDSSAKLLRTDGISTKTYKYLETYRCAVYSGKDDELALSTLSSQTSSVNDDATQRFLRAQTKVSNAPRSFDWREELGGACRDQIEQVYDQGQCGACYAHAVAATLADRACIAAAKSGRPLSGPIRLSANDMLSCGTKQEGKICVIMHGDRKVTRYANHCDGGVLSKAHEYAVDRGLKLEECDPFDILGADTVNEWETKLFNGQSKHCYMITSRDFKGGNIGCGSSYIPLEKGKRKISVDDMFCNCDSDSRFFDNIEEDGRVFAWRDKDGFRVAMVHFGNNQCVVDPTRHSTVNTEIGCSNPESSLADFMLKPFEKQTGRLETETLGVGT